MYYDAECKQESRETFRDSCIFEMGVIYINEVSKNIEKALPWHVFVRPAEVTYNKLTRLL